MILAIDEYIERKQDSETYRCKNISTTCYTNRLHLLVLRENINDLYQDVLCLVEATQAQFLGQPLSK